MNPLLVTGFLTMGSHSLGELCDFNLPSWDVDPPGDNSFSESRDEPD